MPCVLFLFLLVLLNVHYLLAEKNEDPDLSYVSGYSQTKVTGADDDPTFGPDITQDPNADYDVSSVRNQFNSGLMVLLAVVVLVFAERV